MGEDERNLTDEELENGTDEELEDPTGEETGGDDATGEEGTDEAEPTEDFDESGEGGSAEEDEEEGYVEIIPEKSDKADEVLPRYIFNAFQRKGEFSFDEGGNSPVWFNPEKPLRRKPQTGDVIWVCYAGVRPSWGQLRITKSFEKVDVTGSVIVPPIYKLYCDFTEEVFQVPQDENIVNKGFNLYYDEKEGKEKG